MLTRISLRCCSVASSLIGISGGSLWRAIVVSALSRCVGCRTRCSVKMEFLVNFRVNFRWAMWTGKSIRHFLFKAHKKFEKLRFSLRSTSPKWSVTYPYWVPPCWNCTCQLFALLGFIFQVASWLRKLLPENFVNSKGNTRICFSSGIQLVLTVLRMLDCRFPYNYW